MKLIYLVGVSNAEQRAKAEERFIAYMAQHFQQEVTMLFKSGRIRKLRLDQDSLRCLARKFVAGEISYPEAINTYLACFSGEV